MKNNRRDFIKKIGTLGGAGLLASTPIIASMAKVINESEMSETD